MKSLGEKNRGAKRRFRMLERKFGMIYQRILDAVEILMALNDT